MADNADHVQGGGQNSQQQQQWLRNQMMIRQQQMQQQLGNAGQNENGPNQGHRQALQQLMVTLRNQNPNNPDQQQQILNILDTNPQLMYAFIRQRQQAQMNQNANVPRINWAKIQEQKQQQKQQQKFSQSLSGENCIRQQAISLMDQNQEQLVECPCPKKQRLDVSEVGSLNWVHGSKDQL